MHISRSALTRLLSEVLCFCYHAMLYKVKRKENILSITELGSFGRNKVRDTER